MKRSQQTYPTQYVDDNTHANRNLSEISCMNFFEDADSKFIVRNTLNLLLTSYYWTSVANAPNVLQSYWLIVLALNVPALTASLLL